MSLLRKIKTAIGVLKSAGAKEVFGLLSDNFRSFFSRIKIKIGLVYDKYSMTLTSGEDHEGKLHILYVTTSFENYHSQTVRYRIQNVREALKGEAQTKLSIIDEGANFQKETLKWADIIVIMRAPISDEIKELANIAKELHTPLVFDIDDIVFLPEYAPLLCRAFGDTNTLTVRKEQKKFEDYQKVFDLCNFATASTPFIAEKMKEVGKKAYLIHNGLNKTQLRIAKNATRTVGTVRAIGYLSGTKTHDRDFEQALPAITRILREYPDVVLRVAGYLDVSIFPEELSKCVIQTPYMSWQRLMLYGAENYINIAPLDIENPFCHAKSELKYFEAAAVGVPTIASATVTFEKAIDNGKTGMLARNTDEWYSALKKLLDDKNLYNEISDNAYDAAMSHYSPKNTADEALTAYKDIIKEFKSSSRG